MMTVREYFRELRHSQCLMAPTAALLLLLMAVLSLAILIFSIPSFIFGVLLSSLTVRGNWLVEFLYPTGLARWGHLLILRWSAKKNSVKLPLSRNDKKDRKKNGGVVKKRSALHSRSIEQRTEVVRDRVYVHPLPQLLDNIAYLIICLPPPISNNTDDDGVVLPFNPRIPIWGIIVDCADGPSVLEQVALIRDVHYKPFRKNPFKIHAVLSTHKHHDHTAGNRFLWETFGNVKDTRASRKRTRNKKKRRDRDRDRDRDRAQDEEDIDEWTGMMGIVGGAVEQVPYGTVKVADGDRVALPGARKDNVASEDEHAKEDAQDTKHCYGYGNDMTDLVEIECISVPSHTRGSIVYALRNFPASYSYKRAKRSSTKSNKLRSHNEHFDEQNGDIDQDEITYDRFYGNDEPPSPLTQHQQYQNDEVVAHLFAGDAMFSAGGGVPFESDIEFPSDKAADGKSFYTLFKPSSGTLSIDRCFAQILLRGLVDEPPPPSPQNSTLSTFSSSTDATITIGNTTHRDDILNRMLLFPGHEYTVELMARQLDNTHMENLQQWEKHNPSAFFELVSHFFVVSHRRGLPKCARLLTVPTSIRREMRINPQFRSLRRRGEQVLRAVAIWYRYGRRHTSPPSSDAPQLRAESQYTAMSPYPSHSDLSLRNSSTLSSRTESSTTTWTNTHQEVNQQVFTTVYSRDLENIVAGLKDGRMGARKAARKLGELGKKMEQPTLLKRPIPGTLPSEKNMYLGVVALGVLGSPPAGMCRQDAERMRLPLPVENSDHLVVSKRRLVEVLRRLDLLPDRGRDDRYPQSGGKGGGGGGSGSGSRSEGGPRLENDFVEMINLLWAEAKMDIADFKKKIKRRPTSNNISRDDAVDPEDRKDHEDDYLELGPLKQTLYSIPYNQPSWFSKFCMPCSSPPTASHTDPRTNKKLKRSGGELVRHDTIKCPMCWNAIGCPIHVEPDSSDDEEYDNKNDNEVLEDDGQRIVKSVKSEDSNGKDVELKFVHRTAKSRNARSY